MRKHGVTAEKLQHVEALLSGKATLLIVIQDYPDPDAIASAAALRTLANARGGLQCYIAHGGVVGRAENRAMVEYLDLTLHRLEEIDYARFDLIAMVDTQPGTGNNSLPAEAEPDIVIDHHPIRRATRSAVLTDIRSRYGATSSILCEYLSAARIRPDATLATALLYGIRSDTHDLGREATKADIEAYLSLYPVANKRALARIQRGSVPPEYFRALVDALKNARSYGNCVTADLGQTDNPDMLGEVADLLLRRDGAEWSICYGFHGQRGLFSVRSLEPSADCAHIARRVAGRGGTGGGHGALAGGQMPLVQNDQAEREHVAVQILQRFLRLVGSSDQTGEKLIP